VAVSEKVVTLQTDMDKLVDGQPRGKELLKVLYQYPIIDARGVQKHLGVSLDTAITWLQKFEAMNVVREITGQKRGRTYRFDRYIDILDAGWTERKVAAETARGKATTVS
jgi:transposase